MRNAQIREAVAIHLAMIGYAKGSYAWVRPGFVRILAKPDAKLRGDAKSDNRLVECFIEIRLPSGLSRKKLDAELATIAKKGDPKPVAPWRDLPPRGVQLGLSV